MGRFAMESHGKCPKIRPQTPKTPRKNGWFAMESQGKSPKMRSGASWEPLGRLLGAFWAVLGAFGTVLRTSRAVLGASWAVLGVSWAVLEHTGPSWGRQEVPRGLQDTSRRLRDAPGTLEIVILFSKTHMFVHSPKTAQKRPKASPNRPRTLGGLQRAPGGRPDHPGPRSRPRTPPRQHGAAITIIRFIIIRIIMGGVAVVDPRPTR